MKCQLILLAIIVAAYLLLSIIVGTYVMFAICMDLCVITFIIGYNHEISKIRTMSEKAVILERFGEYLKGIK